MFALVLLPTSDISKRARQKNDGLNFFLKVNVLYNVDSLGRKKQMLKVA